MLDVKKFTGYGQGMTDYPSRLRRWKLNASPPMTYAQLGKVCGVTGALVCQWMTGHRSRPSGSDIDRLGAALGVSGQEVAAAHGELQAALTMRRAQAQRSARCDKMNMEGSAET